MPITITQTKRASIYPPVFMLYGPGLVLREEANWRNWRRYNGIGIRLSDRILWLELRGPKEKMKPGGIRARFITHQGKR